MLLRRARNTGPRRHTGNTRAAATSMPSVSARARNHLEDARRTHTAPDPLRNRVDGGKRSPTGYAIMQVTGTANDLSPGIAIAIRRSPEEPWTLCVVRWIRTETGAGRTRPAGSRQYGQTRFGRFRNAENQRPCVRRWYAANRRARTPAGHPRSAGTYSARRFMLVSDIQRLYIAQGACSASTCRHRHRTLPVRDRPLPLIDEAHRSRSPAR
jgi:hypothetical protein